MQHWFVVISKPSQEARAALELTKQDFPVFLPILNEKPMFPRYLFVAFDVARSPWGVIKNTRGCVDLIRNGFNPSPVPAGVMETLMAYRPLPEPEQDENQFTKGQAVKIVEGPLAGIAGLFVADKNRRVSCLLEILGKRVEVGRDSIRAA